ncbi:endonuclease/exonuclease/phosphatase family protein [candidate division KSB1 bacterium]|nr:endonuclease/exonuclease/phosphatase family protein [candidate division KSB1 bacterium]
MQKIKVRFIIAISMLTLFIIMTCGPSSEDYKNFRVMTFNIRMNTPADSSNAWPNRKDLVTSMVRFHQADLVGFQEVLDDQMEDLKQALPEFGWFGVGRDDGQKAGEYSAIFYRKNRFNLQKQETFWLSETPEVAGSRGWDAACVRIVTWGEFEDNRTGKKFYHFNTHFDHRGEQARKNSVRLLLSKVQSIAGTKPVVVTGDFNFNESSPLYHLIVDSAQVQNLYELFDSKKRCQQPLHGPSGTFQGFKELIPNQKIDYIFVNSKFDVLQHGVLSDRWENRWPSDHLPVLAEVQIK